MRTVSKPITPRRLCSTSSLPSKRYYSLNVCFVSRKYQFRIFLILIAQGCLMNFNCCSKCATVAFIHFILHVYLVWFMILTHLLHLESALDTLFFLCPIQGKLNLTTQFILQVLYLIRTRYYVEMWSHWRINIKYRKFSFIII